MRYVLFRTKSVPGARLRVGALVGDATVADISAALADAGEAPGCASMRAFLELGAKGAAVADAAIKNVA
jgi:hypothetical protein